MINTFFAAIVALFFWGKASKDLEEKTQLASWVRTCVYGVLTFMVMIFYLKTYQVATAFHTIQIIGLKETVNANDKVADTGSWGNAGRICFYTSRVPRSLLG